MSKNGDEIARPTFLLKSLMRPSGRFDPTLDVECIGENEQKRRVYKLIDKNKTTWKKKHFCCVNREIKWNILGRAQLRIEKYLHWLFASSFPAMFGTFIFVYCFIIFAFTLIIWIVCDHEDYVHCIHPSLKGMSDMKRLNYSLHLSWTTFSTVGYGVVYPTTRGAEIWDTFSDPDHSYDWADGCLPLNIACSFESFAGILYASLCGAILVAKISRVHSVAHVIFSTPILLRYPRKQTLENNFEENPVIYEDGKFEEDLNSNSSPKPDKVACPILEFQILNRLSHRFEGELIHCNIVCVAKVIAQQKPTKISKRKSFLRRLSSKKLQMKQLFQSGNGEDKFSAPSIAEKHEYVRVHFYPQFHPCFKRVWRLHHTLDQHSPLLTHPIRKLIKQNSGMWTEEMINAKTFRKSIIFEKLIINFSGTSPISASELCIQQQYYYDDILAGFKFAGACYKKDNGMIDVDSSMISVVKKEKGCSLGEIKKLF